MATVEFLKTVGNSSSINLIDRGVATLLELTNETRSIPHGDGRSQFEYDMAWVRTYLRWAGALEIVSRGVWQLTSHGASLSEDDLRHIPRDVRRAKRKFTLPPPIPAQSSGPHFAISNGVLAFAKISDNGQNSARLRSLYPILRETGLALQEMLAANSGLWPSLERALRGYNKVIKVELPFVDFARLFGEGIVLKNAIEVAKSHQAVGNAYPLSAEASLLADTLIDIHGPFILGTDEGLALISDAERYALSTAEHAQNRVIEDKLIKVLSGDDAPATPEVRLHANDIAGSNEDDPKAQAYVSGLAKNSAIALLGGASVYALAATSAVTAPAAILGFAAGVFGPEAIKKSKVGTEITRQLSGLVDRAVLEFVKKNENLLRGFSVRLGMDWIERSINWINQYAVLENDHPTVELGLRPYKVQIFEDDDENTLRMSNLLIEWGFEVINRASGLSGFGYTKDNKPDIIVSEIIIRKRSRINTIKELSKNTDSVIVFLARDPEILISTDMEDRPVFVVKKPYLAEELYKIMRQATDFVDASRSVDNDTLDRKSKFCP